MSGRWRRAITIGAAGAITGLLAFWQFFARTEYVPTHPLRIGFEANPPLQIRTAGGFSGLSVEIVSDAARRAGIELDWVETGTSSEEAFRNGLVDLWPMMVDLPHRRKFVHFAPPYLHSNNVLLLLEGTPVPGRDFRGPIAVFRLPLLVQQLRGQFPEAQIMEIPEFHNVLSAVCGGKAAAAFFEARAAQGELRERHPDCASAQLRLKTIPELRFHAGLASTFEAAAAADRLQREIGTMFRNGTLAVLIAKYSYFGLDDTWASYQQIQEEKRLQWMTWVGSGMVCALGVTLWLAGSLRERKRVEAALRQSEARFRSLANTAPVMIVASRSDGQATFFNKTWIDFTGRTMEQELGYGWIEGVHPDDRDYTCSRYEQSFAARENCSIEYRLRRSDGEYRHVICTGVPRYEPDGAFGGYIASCVDLTDIRNAQEEAHERQNLESLGVLASGIAHDFNNLLGGTLACSELAQAKLAEGEAPDDELRQIRDVARRGSEIVRQLMIFAGNERGALEPVDVSSLVTEMLELLKVAVSKHAALNISLPKGLPRVRANPAQIRQVVMNLVTNASEAIGDSEGVIGVMADRLSIGSGSNQLEAAKNLPEGDYVRLEVCDTGGGMTPDTQRRAFDPFFTTKFAGRGMGLAMVQRIVRGLGGGIHVVSSPGNGARIQVLLPCVVETAQAKDRRAAVRPQDRESQPLGGICILVVEDEPALLIAISKLLQRRGFSVIQAREGSSALEVIRTRRHRIEAMLLDVTLPGASSREVLEEAERLRPDLVTILTSAYSHDSIRASFAGLKAEHFIRKPFCVDDFVSLLQITLAPRSSTVRAELTEIGEDDSRGA
jgi:PAS domain S-box-containing protein